MQSRGGGCNLADHYLPESQESQQIKNNSQCCSFEKKKSKFFAHERRKKSRKIKQLKPVIKRLQSLSLKQVLIIYKYIFRNIYIIYYTGIDHKRALHKSDFVSGPRIAHLVGRGGVTT